MIQQEMLPTSVDNTFHQHLGGDNMVMGTQLAYNGFLIGPKLNLEHITFLQTKERLEELAACLTETGIHGEIALDALRVLIKSTPLQRMDHREFRSLYDFAFFICRETGQKSLAVDLAVKAWRILLQGRFFFLNDWCEFMTTFPQYPISEDLWAQVLTFIKIGYSELLNFDFNGSWHSVLDDFVNCLTSCEISSGPLRIYDSVVATLPAPTHIISREVATFADPSSINGASTSGILSTGVATSSARSYIHAWVFDKSTDPDYTDSREVATSPGFGRFHEETRTSPTRGQVGSKRNAEDTTEDWDDSAEDTTEG